MNSEWSKSELKINWELIRSEFKINLNLTKK